METNDPRSQQEETPEVIPAPPTEPQPEVELDKLQLRVRSFPEKQWNLIQRILGAALGALCGFSLTYLGSLESIGLYGTIGAVLVALLLPNLIEKRIRRNIQKGRVALLIGLAVWLVGYTLIMLLSGVPILQQK